MKKQTRANQPDLRLVLEWSNVKSENEKDSIIRTFFYKSRQSGILFVRSLVQFLEEFLPRIVRIEERTSRFVFGQFCGFVSYRE